MWAAAEQAATDQGYDLAKRRGLSMEPALVHVVSGAQTYRDSLSQAASVGDDVRGAIWAGIGNAGCFFTGDSSCDESFDLLSKVSGKDFDPRQDEAFIFQNTQDLVGLGEMIAPL